MTKMSHCKMLYEKEYTQLTEQAHIKEFGQYFTNPIIADFMCRWACVGAKTMLDPAVGNSVFFRQAKKVEPNCILSGFEVDANILSFFGNPSNAVIYNEDYLLNDWDTKYDAIVCNPPYNRFQSVINRTEIINEIYNHTGIKNSGYTNLYVLFLIKSIFQMSEGGKVAYIIPTEFLNSKYGTSIKQTMIEKQLLYAIINIQNNNDVFFNAATTTCCILLLNKDKKDSVKFFNISDAQQLDTMPIDFFECTYYIKIDYNSILAEEKWRNYLNHEKERKFENLVKVSQFCSISRGIATGANDFYCFNQNDIEMRNLEKRFFTKCVCRSADVKSIIFSEMDFDSLEKQNKTVFLLDIKEAVSEHLLNYLQEGEARGINKKYLPAGRKPWYSMEQKEIAPIWVSSACRNKIKFVRNLSKTKSLTTFHSIYIADEYKKYTDIIFCYFLTPTAQSILRDNRKELGNGLDKFQPNDLNSANMLDITIISSHDQAHILEIYNQLRIKPSDKHIEELENVFIKYLHL